MVCDGQSFRGERCVLCKRYFSSSPGRVSPPRFRQSLRRRGLGDASSPRTILGVGGRRPCPVNTRVRVQETW